MGPTAWVLAAAALDAPVTQGSGGVLTAVAVIGAVSAAITPIIVALIGRIGAGKPDPPAPAAADPTADQYDALLDQLTAESEKHMQTREHAERLERELDRARAREDDLRNDIAWLRNGRGDERRRRPR